MEKAYPVLRMENVSSVPKIKIEYISIDNIPAELNGESGHHVYHVRMLTELILRCLKKEYPEYALEEEQIEAMSIASSLHDIGKSKVPKSILDFPGTLSPIEYDLIKKHASFGEELIRDAEGEVPQNIRKYAMEIARHHHERIDGSGYPDGLKGDNVPICAQAVSLADSFDALTSERSYKKAFAQDVAIEMIANGMCGIFSEALISCLLKVVNNKLLTDIRDSLARSRRIIGQDVYTPQRVLFIGNTAYIRKDFIEQTFPDSFVTVAGESRLKTAGKLRVFNTDIPPVKKIFETYEFDIIIYFANELSFNSGKPSDAEELKQILKYIKQGQAGARLIYLTSLDAAFSGNSDKRILVSSKENLCEYYEQNMSLDIKVVRIPYLYSGDYEDDFLYKIFYEARRGNTIRMPQIRSARMFFVSMSDLAEMILRFVDNWQLGVGKLSVNDEFKDSFADFEDKIIATLSGAKIDFTGEEPECECDMKNTALRNEYGYFAKISILDDLKYEYDRFLELTEPPLITIIDKIKRWMKEHNKAAKLIELFVLFLVTELLLYITDSVLFFKIVDFRMAYIVLIATVHGLGMGLSSSALSSLSYFFAKVGSGTKWITMFYETTNWLAFIFYFLIGAVCGYVKIRSNNKIDDLEKENDNLERKLIFTRKLYEDTAAEKRDLKKQIIGSKDSFGKIFDITRNLDTVEPRVLYLKIMDCFEDILENKTISVYSVNSGGVFGRLEVASRDILDTASRSISLTEYKDILNTVKSGEIWRNTDLMPNMPMYAAGVRRNNELELLIFIWHTRIDQRSLYYVNLFKILSELAQMSLLRAYDYTQATYEKQYIKNTHILNKENFAQTLNNFKSMSERKVFSYMCMKIQKLSYSYEELDRMLVGKIRANDVMGVISETELGILFSQATKDDLKFILPRFENLSLKTEIIEG